jgi:hypothetical protein
MEYFISAPPRHIRCVPLEWKTDPTIKSNLPGCPVGFLVLEDMWKEDA